MPKFEGTSAQLYERLYAQHGIDNRSLMVPTGKAQRRRMEAVAFALKMLENPGVLDLGCGFGDLLPELEITNKKAYVGVDQCDWMTQIAGERFPFREFVCADAVAYLQALPVNSISCSVAMSTMLTMAPGDTDHLLSQISRTSKHAVIGFEAKHLYKGAYYAQTLNYVEMYLGRPAGFATVGTEIIAWF